MSSDFKQQMTFEERKSHSLLLANKFPDKIPIIIQRSKKDRLLKDLDKVKYLVPYNITILDCINILRRRLLLTHNTAIFLFASSHNVLLSPSQSIYELYNKYKDNDGFIYIEYSAENTFG